MKIPGRYAKTLRQTPPSAPAPQRDETQHPAEPTNLFLFRYLIAVDLARGGRYDEAERYARNVAEHESSLRAQALELLGKIYAQQGRYLDAERCWMQALSIDPSNLSIRRAIEYLRTDREPPLLRLMGRVVFNILLVAIVVLLAFLIYDALRRYEWNSAAPRSPVPESSSDSGAPNASKINQPSQGQNRNRLAPQAAGPPDLRLDDKPRTRTDGTSPSQPSSAEQQPLTAPRGVEAPPRNQN